MMLVKRSIKFERTKRVNDNWPHGGWPLGETNQKIISRTSIDQLANMIGFISMGSIHLHGSFSSQVQHSVALA